MGHSKSPDTYILVETAAGYCLGYIKEWDAVNADVISSELRDPSKFKQMIQSKGFYPFKDAEEALANIQSVARGDASEQLVAFLSSTLPSKKKKYQLGVLDNELAKALSKCDFNVFHGKDVFEVVRTCRQNLKSLVASLEAPIIHQFQIGLGHSFSRSKIATDPARQDKHCQQAVATLELSEKTVNKLAMRLKEWYGWHFPELIKIVPDNLKFAQTALHIGRRDAYDWEAGKLKLLEILDNSEAVVSELEQAFKMSMGQDIVELDWMNIKDAAEQVVSWHGLRSNVGDYLSNKMRLVAPNLQALVGDQLGGKLITQAGSVIHLAKAPASTIQIFGAEKALFRALKSRGPTPKYGLIFNSGFIGKASSKNKGRISRYLANKIALASRMDAFGETTGTYGESFRQQVEDRLKFLTEGVTPMKNLEVMRIAADRAKIAAQESPAIVHTKIDVPGPIEEPSAPIDAKKSKKHVSVKKETKKDKTDKKDKHRGKDDEEKKKKKKGSKKAE
ncbi:putative nucleolar protein Nop56 [Gregarina niphandrodes]|uniref:Nucleolar protein 56 n=1 Tax=Gregarina niphandrodes TaxID=110365 RepID=A0A023B914_GRENI|nr:putative nucleolar protein Nop56 [Gregarina niphandrodes]EZG70833.1 putative nucleolar protein Nop56 [Gregarina niphandrodes]|eukprot:XP_011129867.1 putative nucleolar protein Nop56 [Gregarina niphandrodes]